MFLAFGFFFAILSVWQIKAAQTGLDVIDLRTSNPPVTIITPSNPEAVSRPTVLIAHGFAGSSLLMRGFALTLAHAGYTTISWDFQGHGENPNPLDLSIQSNALLRDAESALDHVETVGFINTQDIAILGHSMGSGVALSFGVTYPDTYAAIAISPVSQTVTPVLPKNLLLMAGSLESQFVSNAERLLHLAGGKGGSLPIGTARELVIIPNVEHVSILFSPQAHSTTRAWLDGTFGPQPGAENYTDRRMLWFGVGILGSIFLATAGLSSISPSPLISINNRPMWLKIISLLAGSLFATLILWLVSLAGLKLNQLLGVLVGGYLLFWFGLAGVISLVLLRPRISLPKSRELICGLVAFAALWLGVGLLGHFVWLPWLLIPYRFWLWLPGSILLLPWFFAVGETMKHTRPVGRLGWWIFQTITIVMSLYLAIQMNPELGFLFIILPLVPVIIGLHLLVISSRYGSWAFSISGAMFLAWLLLAVFPLQ